MDSGWLMRSRPDGIAARRFRGAPPPVGSLLDAFDRATLKIAIAPPRIAFASVSAVKSWARTRSRSVIGGGRTALLSGFLKPFSALHPQGTRVFLVAGPESAEAAIVSNSFPEPTLVLDSLQAGESDWSAMLKSLKMLYLGGVRVDSVGFDRDYARSKIEAPTYPFRR
jgi:acyl transferase domain-containing protein